MSDISPDDRDLAIRTMLGEEGSEAGRAGVAAVILNRMAAGSYGASLGDVVLAPNQFEAWTRQGDQLLGVKRDDPNYVAAGQIFDAVRSGAIPDPTNGATHFYAPVAQAALGRSAPTWAGGQGLKLGASMFYAPQGRVDRKPETPLPDMTAGLQQAGAERQLAEVGAQRAAPNRPPAFLKDAVPVNANESSTNQVQTQVPDRPPAFLKDAKPATASGGTGFLETSLSEIGRVPTEAPKAIGEMFREGTSAEFDVGKQNVARGVAQMKTGPTGWLGGAMSDVVGTLQEASSPFVGAANALLGVGAWTDPAMTGAEAPHVASYADAAKFAGKGAAGAGIDARAAAEGRGAVQEALSRDPRSEVAGPQAVERAVGRGAAQAGDVARAGEAAVGRALPNRPPAFLKDARPVESPSGEPIVGYKTAKGSTYEVHAGGETTRTKSDHTAAGHDPGDVGVKQKSVKTIYVDPRIASALSAAGITAPGGTSWRVALRDGKATLISRRADRPWGAAPESRGIPFSLTPEVGKAPVELWKLTDDVPGHESYSGMHAGNEITEVTRRTGVAGRSISDVERPMEGPLPGGDKTTIDVPKAQGLIDELRKRFGIEKPIPVSIGQSDPSHQGALTVNWPGDTTAAARNAFRLKGILDPNLKKPISYSLSLRPGVNSAYAAATLMHEFGHAMQYEKYASASAETRAAILTAFRREMRGHGALSGDEYLAAAHDPAKNAVVQDVIGAGDKGRLDEAAYQKYNSQFNEWFANQVSTWLTSNKEATSVVDKFFKGIADAWKFIYQRVAGRQGATPEIDAFMRGMWDAETKKPIAEKPRATEGATTIEFRGQTYTGATKLEAARNAQRATGVSLDRVWDESTPGKGASAAPTLPKDIPTTVYRGTGRADSKSAYNQGFGQQSVPIAGPGRYFAFKKSDAQTFGPSVAQAELPVKNPLVIRDGKEWRDLTRRAGWQTPNPFGTSEAQMRGQTQRLQDLVRGMGHDGIVAFWDDASPYDIGPKGEDLKLLRNTFGVPQAVAFEERAPSWIPLKPVEETPHEPPSDEETPTARLGDLGAVAASPAPALPARPTREAIWEQEDRFNRLSKAPAADKSELLNTVDSWPQRMRTAAAQERFYRHMEDPSFPLTAQEAADYDAYVKPLKREELALWEEAKKTDLEGLDDYDPAYAHRMVKGRNPHFDRVLGQSAGDDPFGGTSRLPQSTSSMKPRVFFAIQDAASGERLVVARGDDGDLRIVEPGRPAHPVGGADLKVGDALSWDKRVWTLEQARTHEIEANTDLKYYKNAAANTIDNIVRLRQVVRAIHEVERLKASPEWQAYARRMGEPGIPDNWREPRMPLFRGWRLEPRLADVIDDFYGHERGSLTEKLAKISRWSVGTMFWSPATHWANVGAHWFTARGWDHVTPQGMVSLAADGARAVREVIGRGPKYQQLLREGNGLLYASTSLHRFNEIMLKRLGEDVVRNPAKWDPIARVLGVGPSDLVKMIYEGSSRALWAGSDIMMMQRVLELERKGMSTREAITETERDIPPYRAHSEILGSRTAAQIYFNPVIAAFSRYHYGQMNSWANIAKDLTVGGKDPLGGSRRFQAVGKIMAVGFLMTVVVPIVNEQLKKAFGSKAHLPPRGSLTLPQPFVDAAAQTKWAKEHFSKAMLDYYNDDSDLLMTAENLLSLGPMFRGFVEAFPANRDLFTGRQVAETAEASDALHDAMKGKFKQAGGEAGRFVLQEAEHAGERLVSPFYSMSRILQGDKGLVKGMIEQALGVTEPNTGGIAKVRKREESEARYRRRHPRGPLEGLGERFLP